MMANPFRRYCFALAEKLGMSIHGVLSMSSPELTGWMAYHRTMDDTWQENHTKELELQQQRDMSAEDKAAAIKRLLGGAN